MLEERVDARPPVASRTHTLGERSLQVDVVDRLLGERPPHEWTVPSLVDEMLAVREEDERERHAMLRARVPDRRDEEPRERLLLVTLCGTVRGMKAEEVLRRPVGQQELADDAGGG